MKPPRVQLFSGDEYGRRLQAVRRLMAEKRIDALLVHKPENIYYLTGYQTPGYYWHQALIIPLDSEPVFIPPPHEASLVPEFCWIDDVRMYPDTSDWAEVTANVLKDKGLGSAAVGIEQESWFQTVSNRDGISNRLLPGGSLKYGSGIIERVRLIKSPQELAYMREAAGMSAVGMKAGIDAAVDGATELEVAAAVHSALDLVGSEYSGLPAFITSGPRTQLVHATWSPRAIGPGELVFLEIPGSRNRYHAAHSRSVFTGQPTDVAIAADETSKAALAAAKRVVRPGVPAREVLEAGSAVINSSGLPYKQGRRIAYGIGIAFPPGWDEGDILSINGEETMPLQAGMTFHLITTMRLPGVGAFGCSDTVLVTETGIETLTKEIPPGLVSR